jgi:hypothetical protein
VRRRPGAFQAYVRGPNIPVGRGPRPDVGVHHVRGRRPPLRLADPLGTVQIPCMIRVCVLEGDATVQPASGESGVGAPSTRTGQRCRAGRGWTHGACCSRSLNGRPERRQHAERGAPGADEDEEQGMGTAAGVQKAAVSLALRAELRQAQRPASQSELRRKRLPALLACQASWQSAARPLRRAVWGRRCPP